MDKIATTPGLAEAMVHLAGFLFVLVVLSVLWLMVEIIGARFRTRDKKQAADIAAADRPKSVVSSLPSEPEGIPEEELVAISAAITLMVGGEHRVISINGSGVNWGREGRRQHVQSHTFRISHPPVPRAARIGLSLG